MRFGKGSGMLVLSIIVLASVLLAYEKGINETIHKSEALLGKDAQYVKLATLKNVILESCKKSHDEGWGISVISLADEYGISVFFEGNDVILTSNELGAEATFSLPCCEGENPS